MQIATQLALFLANKPGTLVSLCEVLARAKINIYAISTSDTIDHSVVRIVVDQPRKALYLFEEFGTLVVENEVLMIDGSNRPGSLATIAKELAKNDINIEYAYCATSPRAKNGLLILRPSNVAKALKVLNTRHKASSSDSSDEGLPVAKAKKSTTAQKKSSPRTRQS